MNLQVDRYIRRAEEGTDREIYVAFREIVDLYIVVGSELEVNIEAAMRNKVLQVRWRPCFCLVAFGLVCFGFV